MPDQIPAFAPEFNVGAHCIGTGHPTLVIAEIGINHEGSADRCAEMIQSAARAGADAIKLQTVDADASYDRASPSYLLFKGAELSREETARMADLARQVGVAFFTTTADMASVEWLDRLDLVAWKVSSGLLTTTPLIRRLAQTGKPLLMSSGMAEPADLDDAVEAAAEGGAKEIGLFQCQSIYPVPIEEINLATIGWMAQRYGVPVGFSDHTQGPEAAALAVIAGATMIEKHYSFDRSRDSYDHHLSLEEDGLAEMVRGIRRAERIRGLRGKRLGEKEKETARWALRVLVARKPVRAGEIFTTGNLTFRRPPPGTVGLPATAWDTVLGRPSRVDLAAGQPLPEDAVTGRGS